MALAIKRTDSDRKQKHVALVYREPNRYKEDAGDAGQHEGTNQHRADEQWALLHLGWHHQFHHERWDGTYHWVPFEHIDSEVLDGLVDLAMIIGSRHANREIPYSVLFLPGPYFDQGGSYVKQGVGHGLTCATFILAVFRRWNLPLIDEATWPEGRKGDAPWVLNIVRVLYRWTNRYDFKVPANHFFAQIRQRWDLRRYRPEEICACPSVFRGTPPLSFETVNPLAISLLKQLPR